MTAPHRATLIYIAGPYTAPDPVVNVNTTVRFATDLYRFSLGSVVPVIPHLFMLWHAITPMPYEDWLNIDLAVLERCDGIVRLPGVSSGADGEIQHAARRDMPTWESTGDDANGVCAWAVNLSAGAACSGDRARLGDSPSPVQPHNGSA